MEENFSSSEESDENQGRQDQNDEIQIQINYNYPHNTYFYPLNDVDPREYCRVYLNYYNQLILKHCPSGFAPYNTLLRLQIPIHMDKDPKKQAEIDFIKKINSQ